MAISYKEAEKRIKAYCRPQLQWLHDTANPKDHRDMARIVGYEDGVRDAIKALRLAVSGDKEARDE
jgi:hypothetical protein